MQTSIRPAYFVIGAALYAVVAAAIHGISGHFSPSAAIFSAAGLVFCAAIGNIINSPSLGGFILFLGWVNCVVMPIIAAAVS